PSAYFSDLTEVFNVARRGMAFGLGNGSVQLSPIHGADLADFCLAKLSDDAGTWDVGGPEVLTYRQGVQLAFQTLGRKERYLPIPGVVASSAVWLTDRVSPRAASLTRFFLECIRPQSVGARRRRRTLGEYAASGRQWGRSATPQLAPSTLTPRRLVTTSFSSASSTTGRTLKRPSYVKSLT